VAPIFEEPGSGAAENMKAVYEEVKKTLSESVAAAREVA
jgi:hypothetical protein